MSDLSVHSHRFLHIGGNYKFVLKDPGPTLTKLRFEWGRQMEIKQSPASDCNTRFWQVPQRNEKFIERPAT